MPWAKLNPMKPNLYTDSFQHTSQLCFKRLCVKTAVWNSEHIFSLLLLKQYKKYWRCSQASLQIFFNPKCTLSLNYTFTLLSGYFCFCGGKTSQISLKERGSLCLAGLGSSQTMSRAKLGTGNLLTLLP